MGLEVALTCCAGSSTIPSSLSAQLQECPESSQPWPEPTTRLKLELYNHQSQAPAGSLQGSPQALQHSLPCSVGKPALLLPAGSQKVLFVTGKVTMSSSPLLFLACALSPSEPGSWTRTRHLAAAACLTLGPGCAWECCREMLSSCPC